MPVLLAGALAIAIPTGVVAAVLCASRPRPVATRTVETLGLLFYSMPAYLFAFALLLLFEPSFGAFHVPLFFHPGDYERPGDDLWQFLVTNMVLVEYVFFVPGFLGRLKRALAPGKLADVALVQGLALWGAVLIVAVSVLADLVLVTLDPRVR